MDLKSELEGYTQNWISRKVAHPANLKVDFHFHSVEEWLKVLSGSGSFYRVNGTEVLIVEGDILHIPQGEIHRVDVGPEGLLYEMYIPMEISSGSFSNPLDQREIQLMLTHLNLPVYGDRRDSDRMHNVFGGYSEVMLKDLMSDGFSFRTATGRIMDKDGYLARDTDDATREVGGNGSLCVLHRCAECIVISSVVDVPSKAMERFLTLGYCRRKTTAGSARHG